jgi:hypothetical protein
MLPSYEALYEHGRLHWLGETPHLDQARVIVTVIETVAPRAEPNPPNGRELALLLEEMAANGVADAFGDPLEWQRQERADRPLPGRDDP